MKFYKSAMLVATMLLGFSTLASASTKGVCGGDNGSPSLCDNPQEYSETFKVDSFNNPIDGFNKFYASFDAITQPNLTIESAYLTVSSNSNGHSDSVWAKDYFWGNDLDWDKVGKLKHFDYDGTKTFELESSFFDDILSGLNIKVWFGNWKEKPFWAELTVNGKYCPPVGVSEVPVPAALWLFGSGLMGFTAMRRRKKTA